MFNSDPNYFPQGEPQFTPQYNAFAVRVIAVIAGKNYHVKHVGFEWNAHGASDTATVTLSLKSCPDFTQALGRSNSTTATVPVSIYMGVFTGQPPVQNLSIAGLTLMFAGIVDLYSIDFDPSAYFVTFNCRSNAAPLIDNRITAIALKMKTTDFVTNIAKQYGLTAHILLPKGVISSTVADVYRHEFAVGIQNKRIWDTLLDFAALDDVDVWVSGTDLYYAAPSLIPRNKVALVYGRDFAHSPRFQHSLNGAQSIRVEVRSYDPRTRISSIQRVQTDDDGGVTITNSAKVVTASPQFGTAVVNSQSISSTGAVTNSTTTTLGGSKLGNSGGPAPAANGPLIYKFYEPGLSQDQANKKARALWRQYSMHLFTGQVSVPMTPANYNQIKITSLLQISGFPFLALNDNFWPRKVALAVDIDGTPPVFDIDMTNLALPIGQV